MRPRDSKCKPYFKAARKKDRERLVALEEENDIVEEISELQVEIERKLQERRAKMRGPYSKMAKEQQENPAHAPPEEEGDADRFVTLINW